MWTPTTRAQHGRAGLRYGSDLTDAEWLILAPFLPAPRPCGCPRKWEMREIVNAIFYVLRGGIAWSFLPKDFPPAPTVHRWFARFRDDGTWERINHHLVMLDRERVGREASPTAVVIDSQSVKTTESGGIRGYDAGKKIKSRKRHAMVDTDGRALKLQAHSAAIQDRDGAGPLLRASRASWPFVALGYADGGYAGPRSPTPAQSASRSCAKPTTKSASPSLHDAGWSSASSPGSTETGGWRRVSKPASNASKHSSTLPPACSCYGDWLVEHSIRNGL